MFDIKKIVLSFFICLGLLSFLKPSYTYAASCVNTTKKLGDADCKKDNNNQDISLSDFEIWRKEFFNQCSQANLAGCSTDDDADGSAMDANFNFAGSGAPTTDTVVNLNDFEIWRKSYFAGISSTITPTSPPNVSTTPPVATPTTQAGAIPASIVFRNPYQQNAQPALTFEKFDITYWVNSWDIQPNGKNVHLVLEKMNTKTAQIDELSESYMDYKSMGTKTYPEPTCDTPSQTVLDKRYYVKDYRIPITGLQEGGYYRATLELANADNSSSGIKATSCFEVNRELLTSLVHVNKTPGNNGGTPDNGNPLYLNAMKQQIAQAKAQLGTIPPCPDHDTTKWHAIFDPVRKCHYDHEHKDDPNRSYFDNPSNVGRNGRNRGVGDVLSVLGPAWGWLSAKDKAQLPTSYTISYPWQTWSGTDIGATPGPGIMENDLKHNGYGWLVRTPDDMGSSVTSLCTAVLDGEDCITHFRFEVHALAGMPDALAHTHSFFLEARVCAVGSSGTDNSKCGIYRGGGHIGFGRFGTNRTSITDPGQQELLPFFYTDGPSKVQDLDGNGKLDPYDYNYMRPDGTLRSGGIRLHGAMASDDVRASARNFTWYPESRPSQLGLAGASFGPLIYTPKNVTYNTSRYHLMGPEWSQIRRQVYYCEDQTRCRWPNGAQREAHFVIIKTPKDWDGQSYDEDKSKNGFFSFHGYTNRWGDFMINHQCDNQPMGPDCVPTEYNHVPVNDQEAQHRDSSKDIPDYNYDIAPVGEYWVQFPN